MAPMIHWWLWTQFIYNTCGIRIGVNHLQKSVDIQNDLEDDDMEETKVATID